MKGEKDKKLILKRIQKIEAYAMDIIAKPLQMAQLPISENCKKAFQLAWQEPDILTEMDQYFNFVHAIPIRQLSNGFRVIPTKVGNIIVGTGNFEAQQTNLQTMVACNMNEISKLVRNFGNWRELES